MAKLRLSDEIKKSRIIVHCERYAYLKSDKMPADSHFMVSKDDDEITIITSEHKMKKIKYSDSTKWFKLFEVRTNSPFLCIGFIAKIASTIAKAGLTILVVSTFSKDYFLIHEEDSEKAVSALQEIGFTIDVVSNSYSS